MRVNMYSDVAKSLALFATTPAAQRMNRAVAKGRLLKFLTYLKRNYPIKACPLIILTLCKDKIAIPEERGGGTALGMVNFLDDHVHVVIYSRQHPWLALKAVAHEYRHLIQSYLLQWDAQFIIAADMDREHDAAKWSQKVTMAYINDVC